MNKWLYLLIESNDHFSIHSAIHECLRKMWNEIGRIKTNETDKKKWIKMKWLLNDKIIFAQWWNE